MTMTLYHIVKQSGHPPHRVLRTAGLSPSLYGWWRKGCIPKQDTTRRVLAALDRLDGGDGNVIEDVHEAYIPAIVAPVGLACGMIGFLLGIIVASLLR